MFRRLKAVHGEQTMGCTGAVAAVRRSAAHRFFDSGPGKGRFGKGTFSRRLGPGDGA